MTVRRCCARDGRTPLPANLTNAPTRLDEVMVQGPSFATLDAAAVEAVQHWEFEVVTTVPVRAEVPIRFQLVK